MNKLYLFVTSVVTAMFFVSCGGNYFEVNTLQLQQRIYEPTITKYEGLQQSMVLYLDHSTCVIDARQNSKVFKSLMGQLGLYTDTLCLIKGSEFEQVPNTDKSPTSTDVYNIINSIGMDIPFANIGQAVKTICESNSQAILITDCEYFDKNGKNQDGFPYLSGSFKDWVKRGYSIYIVVEPYQEKNKGKVFDKKRFYFIFSDDRMDAPISHNILNEIQPFLQDSVCKLYKLTNSDITVQYGNDMIDKDLDFTVANFNGFEFVEISSDWNTIREYVMKLNEYGELLENDEGNGKAKPIPLLKNIEFHDSEDYFIRDMKIVATNITSQYVALEDKTIIPNYVDMSEGFELDKKALQSHKLNVYLTEKIFNYLADEDCFGGNLIRLDFIVTKVGVQDNYNADMFTWQSLYNNEKAICVAKSIDNVLHDVEIAPTSKDRQVIHTIFLKTESYKQ